MGFLLHLKDKVQLSTGMMYAGSAVGAVFAGDFVTLFFFWSCCLMSLGGLEKPPESYGAGQRYLMFHLWLIVVGGCSITLQRNRKFDIAATSAWRYCVVVDLLAIGIKCSFPVFRSGLSTPIQQLLLWHSLHVLLYY